MNSNNRSDIRCVANGTLNVTHTGAIAYHVCIDAGGNQLVVQASIGMRT